MPCRISEGGRSGGLVKAGKAGRGVDELSRGLIALSLFVT
jgi:hypothetical protein